MKPFTIFIITFVILTIPSLCLAGRGTPGGYSSAFIGAQFPESTDTPSTDFVTGYSYNDRVEFNPGLNIGGTGGYDFGMIRLEGELSYKYSTIRTITDQNTGSRYNRPAGNIGVLAWMFNGFIDFHNNSRITPYLGGGIGFATIALSDTHGRSAGSGTSSNPLLYGAGNDTVFAWQAGAGLEIALNRKLSLDIGYRYFDSDRAYFDSDLAILSSMKFVSHTTAVGVRFKY